MPRKRQLISTRARERDDSAVMRFTGGSLALTRDNAAAFRIASCPEEEVRP
jgi:hypothetical protein